MKSSWLLLAVPALLSTTALVRADDAHPIFSLSATGGGVIMDLPDGGGTFQGEGVDDDGLFSGDDLLLGVTLGFSASTTIGQVNGYDATLGVSGFATYATGNFNTNHTFTGSGVVIIQGGAGPNLGAISIATSTGPLAHAEVHTDNTSPQNNVVGADVVADTNPGPGAQDVPFTSGSGESFQWGGAQTAVLGPLFQSATAYAALADTNGGVFIAAGNLDGLSITTDHTTEAFYAGGDLTFGLSGELDSTPVQGYVGPSYRYLAQRNSTNAAISVDVPEYTDPDTFPLFTMSSTEELASHYLGGVGGLSATLPVNQTSAITIGVEAGAYYTMASLDSSGVYTVEGGELPNIAPNVPGPYALQTVTADGETYEADTIAFAARGTAVYTVALDDRTQLSFSGTVDYLSAVAQSAVNATVTGYDGDDDGTVTYVSGGSNDRISWGSMVNFSGSVSLTGQF